MRMCGGNSKSCMKGSSGIRAAIEAAFTYRDVQKKKGEACLAPALHWEKCSRRDHVMRVNHKFLGRAFVKVLVALGRVLQRNHRYVYRLGDLNLVVQNRHHQIAVVALH